MSDEPIELFFPNNDSPQGRMAASYLNFLYNEGRDEFWGAVSRVADGEDLETVGKEFFAKWEKKYDAKTS